MPPAARHCPPAAASPLLASTRLCVLSRTLSGGLGERLPGKARGLSPERLLSFRSRVSTPPLLKATDGSQGCGAVLAACPGLRWPPRTPCERPRPSALPATCRAWHCGLSTGCVQQARLHLVPTPGHSERMGLPASPPETQLRPAQRAPWAVSEAIQRLWGPQGGAMWQGGPSPLCPRMSGSRKAAQAVLRVPSSRPTSSGRPVKVAVVWLVEGPVSMSSGPGSAPRSVSPLRRGDGSLGGGCMPCARRPALCSRSWGRALGNPPPSGREPGGPRLPELAETRQSVPPPGERRQQAGPGRGLPGLRGGGHGPWGQSQGPAPEQPPAGPEPLRR